MSISKTCNSIFQQVIDDYHLQNFVDANKNNPYDNSNFFEKRKRFDKKKEVQTSFFSRQIFRLLFISDDSLTR